MRKGSLEYWPHRRAKKQMPRMRTWPAVAEQGFLGSVAFKAGMTHITMVDDSSSPAKGSEVAKPVTILEIPKVYIYGIRMYHILPDINYKEPAAEAYSAELAKRVGIKNVSSPDGLAAVKAKLGEYGDAVALAFVDPSNLGSGNKKLMRFELAVGGKDVAEKVAFIEKWMGKELKASDVIKVGDYIDVKAISKGKGWAGVIKRFGVARQVRKATGKIRHLGVLGAWHPAKVLYTVPHSGHMGYNFRMEMNKRVLMMGTDKDVAKVNVKGGFLNYGVIKNDYMMLEGSIPGPAKRLIRFRKSVRNKKQPKQPQIAYVSLVSKG
ncbi:MAG: 50S ribosomal protein L3 [Candidatus Micrarchaeota archaeon]|nr:50S ribosomal protein L3 [Candidatus Micrarchaeota archaeon]